MPTVKIRGQVRHFHPLGAPCQKAVVKVYDKDVGGGGDDLIFTGKTDANGVFKGRSKNWKDRNTMRVSTPLGTVTQEVPDVLLLQVKVQQGSKKVGPFPYIQVPDGLPMSVVPVPWGPPNAYLAKVNGKKCKDGFQLQKAARAAFESGTPKVRIQLVGPEAVLFLPLTGSMTQLKKKVEAVLPGAKHMLYVNPTGAEELLAIAVVILALGAAFSVGILATAVAFSLILALVLGYKSIRVVATPGTQAQPLPRIEFVVEK
jgi:hypothetical protein